MIEGCQGILDPAANNFCPVEVTQCQLQGVLRVRRYIVLLACCKVNGQQPTKQWVLTAHEILPSSHPTMQVPPPAPALLTQTQAEELTSSIYSTLKQVELAISTQQSDFVGVRTNSALQLTARLELLQSPGLPYILPKV